MDFLINIGARLSGYWNTVHELLPLLGGVASLLSVGAAICTRAAASQDAASLLHSLQPTPSEVASAGLAVGLIKAHFNHQQNATAIVAVQTANESQSPK